MEIIPHIYAIFLVLTNYYATSQRHPSWNCEDVLHPNYPRKDCYYECYSAGRRWVRGTLNDGTACVKGGFPRRPAQCMRGVCVLIEDGSPQFNSTFNQRCDGQYPGKGFAPTCQYTCSHLGRRKKMRYVAGTPCINLDEEDDRVINAGICFRGVCTPYYKLEGRHHNIKKKVFTQRQLGCPDKPHYGRNVLGDCHHYCKVGNEWFYGFYKSDFNSACEVFYPQRMSGYCCKGECMRTAHCGQALEDTTEV
uniref:Basic tail secreted protein n=1 Tax=Rhipicephalus zambeziensis TaxID=60191 RepID=A0A224YCI1_9ACAR